MMTLNVIATGRNNGWTMEQVSLTPEQRQKWGNATSMMAWVAPGFRHLWYKLLAERNNNGASEYVAVFTRDVPVAATDGKNVLVNPDKFFQYSLAEQVYILVHEIIHNVYDDVNTLHRCSKSGKVPMMDGSFLPFDNTTMQIAMDCRINALNNASKIGKMPKDACINEKIGADCALLDAYKLIYNKKRQEQGQGGQQGRGKGNEKGDNPGGGFDQLLPPGSSTGQSAQEAADQRNAQQWAVEVESARHLEQMSSRNQGKLPGALQRMFQEILEPEVPWTEHIKSEFARKVGSGAYNWQKGDRRYISRDVFLPSSSGFGCKHVVCWGDTSGSRSDQEITSNMAELTGILEDVRPKRLTIIWCDAKIDYVDELEDVSDLARVVARGVSGGGGTSCHPVFKWIEDHCDEPPDMFIGFTDGYVTFPKNAPSYPVIWASSTDSKYPWGEVVRVNKVVRA